MADGSGTAAVIVSKKQGSITTLMVQQMAEHARSRLQRFTPPRDTTWQVPGSDQGQHVPSMPAATENTCPACQALPGLHEQIQQLRARMQELEAMITTMEQTPREIAAHARSGSTDQQQQQLH